MAEVKSGYVHKCGKSVKSWKRRWFVLKSNGYLYYYEDQSLKSEKGKIDVVDASKVGEWKEISSVNRKLPAGFDSSNAFGIVTGDRTFTCVCENDGESLNWIAAITKVRNADINEKYPEPTYPKEDKPAEPLPVKVKVEAPLTANPPSYSSLPRGSHVSPPPPDTGTQSATLPRPRVATQPTTPQRQAPGTSAMPTLPATNPYYSADVKDKMQGAPQPPVQPQAAPPQYSPQPPRPQYNPQPPQPQYRPMPPPQQAQYRPPPPQPQYNPQPPQPQYRPPPPQPQYRPPPGPPRPQYQGAAPQYYPPQPQPQYRPPPPQPQYRPPPPQPQYQPPPQPYAPPVRGPYQSCPQRPPPVQQYRAPPPQQRQAVQKTTTVTVVTIPAPTQQTVYRRR